MECNKEEAEKCKAISEASLRKLDLVAARRFALKAKQLSPELDGLAQLVSILDVHAAAREKLQNGESNWYAILQVDFRADENTIRKQYRKLALFLHPDKNKSFGAESAFKHVSEAWSVLSDGKRKSDYDKRWYAHMTLQRGQVPYTSRYPPSFQARANARKQHMHAVHQTQPVSHQVQFQCRPKQGQSHAPQQVHCQQQGQAHSQQQQQKGQLPTQQQEQQQHGQVDAHQQQWHGLARAHSQEGACQAHAHHQQQQYQDQKQGQGSVSQAQQDGEGKVHVFQQQGQAHAQQHRQGQTYTREQQWQEEADGLQGKAQTQQQEEGQTHVHQKQGEGQADARVQCRSLIHQQGQCRACQGHCQEYRHQQEGKDQVYVHQHQEPQQEAHNAEHSQPHFSQPAVVHEDYVFWTACPSCKMQFEYKRVYMNRNMCCPMCFSPFFSKEIEPKQGVIIWSSPAQQPKVFSKNDTGDENCTFDQSDRIPRADSNISQKVRSDVKSKGSKKDNFSEEKHQEPPQATMCADKKAVEQVHIDGEGKTEGIDDCNLGTRNRSLAGIKGSGSTSTNGRNSAVASQTKSSGSNRQSIPTKLEQKVHVDIVKEEANIFDESALRVRTCNTIGSKEIEGSLSVMNGTSTAVHPNTPAQKSPAKNGDGYSSRVRTRYSARNKGLSVSLNDTFADHAPTCMLIVQDSPAALMKSENVDSTGGTANVDGGNLRARTHHSTESKGIGGLQKCSSLNKLGSSKMEVSQQKRKLMFSTMIDGLRDSGTMKRSRQSTHEVDPAFKSAEELDSHQFFDNNSSDRSSFQVNVADDLSSKCEMEVPDSDFYNFDEDRTEDHFAVGQIWATYDDDDGMPRYYARVNKILSARPLKMQMNWLEARDPTDETLVWLDAGFQHSCGDFKLGTMYIADQVSTFSHLMKVGKVPKGGYKIYPRKGEVWAVYREWELLKVKDDKHGYDLVEIVASFDEKKGVQVVALLKVAGFKTIFDRKVGEAYMKWIPFHEVRRFSHQVPAHHIVAGEVPGIRNDCIEIDPASVPVDLVTGEQCYMKGM